MKQLINKIRASGQGRKSSGEITVTQLLVTLFFVALIAVIYYVMIDPAAMDLANKAVQCITTRTCSWGGGTPGGGS